MTNEKLKQVLDLHATFLLGKNEGEQADLRGANLRDADLGGADLRDADLGDADLRGADLRDAYLPYGKVTFVCEEK